MYRDNFYGKVIVVFPGRETEIAILRNRLFSLLIGATSILMILKIIQI
jgi:hypothetical protein